jgi:hypothetical protein
MGAAKSMRIRFRLYLFVAKILYLECYKSNKVISQWIKRWQRLTHRLFGGDGGWWEMTPVSAPSLVARARLLKGE